MNDVFSGFEEADHGVVRAATAAAALARRDAARRAMWDLRDDAAGTEVENRMGAVSTLDLHRHANRAPGDPISFPVVVALRTDQNLRRRYTRLLDMGAEARSPMAIAAYSEGRRRVVGSYTVRLMTDGDLPPILVISPAEEGVAPPRVLEAMGPLADGTHADVRIALPAAIRGHVTLPLDPARPDLAELAGLLARPDSALWLF